MTENIIINNTNTNITAGAAVRWRCARRVWLDAEFRTLELEGGYWVAEFTADELWYTCYIDAVTGEIPGLDLRARACRDLSELRLYADACGLFDDKFQELMGRRSRLNSRTRLAF